jgi:dTDP-4-amino-4,6-dideoxygalactose transaminase
MTELAETLRSIRVHGQGSDKYDNVRLGLTGRLDTMQAAVLIEKLKIFEDEIAARNRVAERYARGLGNLVTVPRLASGCTSVWAQYTIRLPKGRSDRDGFAAALKAQGVPTMVYYTKSMHQQTAYKAFPVADGGLPVSEAALGRSSSACRFTPISTRRRRIASSRRCAARFLHDPGPSAGWQAPSGFGRICCSRKRGACSDASSPSAVTRCSRG